MRIRLAVPDELDDQDRKAALDAALESVTRATLPLVRNGRVPPAAAAIKRGLVKWHPEPPGDEHFDLATTVLQRGHGDCDDLAPWHCASLRASGIDPKARAIVKKSGPHRWHAVVKRGDGSIDDPSLAAGMGSGVNGPGALVGVAGAIQRPITRDGRLCLAICPSRDKRHPLVWFARCDVPDAHDPWGFSSMAASRHPAGALLRALKTARHIAGPDIALEDDARLAAVNDLICGAEPEEVYEALQGRCGSDIDVDGCVEEAAQSVGFFGDLFKAVAKPFTSAVDLIRHPSLSNLAAMATSPLAAARGVYHVPGLHQILQAGIPIAASAFGGPFGGLASGAALRLLDQGGGGGPPRVPGAASIPGAVPLSALQQGLPMGMPSGLPMGMPIAQLAELLAQHIPQGITAATAPGLARYGWEAGKMVRPWGDMGPAAMRF